MAFLIPCGQLDHPEVLEVAIQRDGLHALVVVAGEVDLSTVGELYEQLAELAQSDVCHIALNLAEVSFMDASGLSLLVTEHKRAESMKGELIVFSPSRQLRRLFQITGLDVYLNVRPSTEGRAPGHGSMEEPATDPELTGRWAVSERREHVRKKIEKPHVSGRPSPLPLVPASELHGGKGLGYPLAKC